MVKTIFNVVSYKYKPSRPCGRGVFIIQSHPCVIMSNIHRGDLLSLKRRSKKCRASYILLVLFTMLIVVVVVMIHELNEHLEEIAEFRSREAATEVMTSAIDRTLTRCGGDKLYSINVDENGKVLSVQMDTSAANRLKNILTEETERGLEKLGQDGISIPLGTLLGIPLFSGKGTAVKLGVQQLGAVESDFSSRLESAGINQTRLTVYVTVNVEIRAILPDGHGDIKVREDYIINDSIIVGDIPKAYLAK